MDAIRDTLVRLTRDVATEVMAFLPGGAQPLEQLDASRPLDEELLGRGVRMRSVYSSSLSSVRNDRNTVDHANWPARLGGQASTVPSLPTRMIITDHATAAIPVNREDSGAAAVVLTGHGTLTALCALFETVWGGAQAPGEAVVRDGHGLSPQESATVDLLARGHTDEAIAETARCLPAHRAADRDGLDEPAQRTQPFRGGCPRGPAGPAALGPRLTAVHPGPPAILPGGPGSPPGPLSSKAVCVQRSVLPQVRDPGQS